MGALINTEYLEYPKCVESVKPLKNGVLLGVDDEFFRVEVLRPDVMRLKISRAGVFDETPTFAASFKAGKPPRFEVAEDEDRNLVVVSTDRMRLEISREPFAVDAFRADGSVIFTSARVNGQPQFYGYLNDKIVLTRSKQPKDIVLGLGEKTRGLNKNGHDYLLWNNDILAQESLRELERFPKEHPDRDPKSQSYDPYYMSIPFFYHIPGDTPDCPAAGFFVDNGYKQSYEFSDGWQYRIQLCGGQYTEYVFAGPSMKEILEGYTWVTGRLQAPPLWALGYHQCRWYPYTQETVLKLAKHMRADEIPCDVLWLDIDYMNGYRVFTWNKAIFPDVPGMLKKVKKDGFRVITIIDPGVKFESGYAVYDEGAKKNLFCKTDSGQTYIGQVWPGRTAFPDFVKPETRAWWGRLNAEHVASGLAGIWNDMNEPATGAVDCLPMRFDRDGKNWPHERYHNQYAMLMAMGTVEGLLKANPEARTFVLSRAGFAGIQRYAANWMGDNMSRWEHLAMSLPMAMGLGLSGQPFVGADIGGFGEATNPELLVRWFQMAALSPFFRNHNCDNKDQYPWAFGKATEELVREAVALRYRLLPYLYTQFIAASETGAPVQRPLCFDYQDDAGTYSINDQYLCGDALLVAPVCQAGVTQRQVYLPAGSWIDLHGGDRYEGGGTVTVDAPLAEIPLFAKGGSVMPSLPEAPQTTMGLRPTSLDLNIFLPAEDGVFTSVLQEDDGETFKYRDGAMLRTTFTLTRKGGKARLQATVSGKGFKEFARTQFRLILHGGEVPTQATLNGKPVEPGEDLWSLANGGEAFSLDLELADS